MDRNLIIYKKMSLFDAPEGSILVHACNAQGVWGSGIAKEFRTKFPLSYIDYAEYCESSDNPVGSSIVCYQENGFKVGCLITSNNYAEKVDSPSKILENTEKALEDLIKPGIPSIFYSNKFNSGLFKVPWAETEKLINEFINKYNLDWVICDPKLGE